jgi:hypothetical protein
MKRKPADRFILLNKCIGYGNPNARIIHLSLLEEGGSWSIPELLEKHDTEMFKENKDLIEKTLADNYGSFDKGIQKLNEKLNLDIDLILDKELNSYNIDKVYYEKIKEYYFDGSVNKIGTEDNTGSRCNTTRFFYEVSSQIIAKYPMYRINKPDYSNFGTIRGNEVCLNLNPLAKSMTNNKYPEYDYFFGEVEENSLLKRKEWIKAFVRKKVDEEAFVFIYGSKPIKFLDLEKSNFKSYKMSERQKSWFSEDLDNRIWWLYHPAARGDYRPKCDEIPYILNPEMRANSKKVIPK